MQFYKYQGTGNDFIVIDDRNEQFNLSKEEIAHLCQRRFGIGADGLMLLQQAPGYDFKMVYYNSDGTLGTMCGNGGRCLVRFAADLHIIQEKASFMAVDGPHTAFVDGEKISLKMSDVQAIDQHGDDFFTNTGSPHFVRFTKQLQFFDVKNTGAAIRYSEAYQPIQGTNANFVEKLDSQSIFVRTYERGVEDETYSCGTGVTAAALVAHVYQGINSPVQIRTLGGELSVSFQGNLPDGFTEIYLTGPAIRAFQGEITSY